MTQNGTDLMDQTQQMTQHFLTLPKAQDRKTIIRENAINKKENDNKLYLLEKELPPPVYE